VLSTKLSRNRSTTGFKKIEGFPQKDNVWFNKKEVVVELRESKGSTCTLASVQSQLSSTTWYYGLYNLQFTCLCHIVNCPNPNPTDFLFIYFRDSH